MGIRVIESYGIGVFKDAVCENSMQVERDNDGSAGAGDPARLRDQISLDVMLTLRCHGAMQRQINTVHVPR